MRVLVLSKYVFRIVLSTVLIVALMAPPLVHACDCQCDLYNPIAPTVDRPSATPPLTASCCCATGCAPTFSADPFSCPVVDQQACERHPVCCCVDNHVKKPGLAPGIPTEGPRFQPLEDKALQTDSAALLTVSQGFIRPCLSFAFYPDLTQTSPHIASTILLI